MVVATGNATVMGKVSLLASRRPQPTSLECEIAAFVRLIATFAFVTATVIVIVWAAWLRTVYPAFMSVSMLITTIIGAVVAFLPDGLPVAVTLTPTMIARRLFESDVVLRSVNAVEMLGSVNVLASDKTGTLTTNRMEVAALVTAGGDLHVGAADASHHYADGHRAVRALVDGAVLCNAASHAVHGGADDTTSCSSDHKPTFTGNATDVGILDFAAPLMDIANMRGSQPTVHEVPFNSKDKFMLTVHPLP